jgi:hypothetical protein
VEEALRQIAQAFSLALDVEKAGVGSEESIEHVVGEKRFLRGGKGWDEAMQSFL